MYLYHIDRRGEFSKLSIPHSEIKEFDLYVFGEKMIIGFIFGIIYTPNKQTVIRDFGITSKNYERLVESIAYRAFSQELIGYLIYRFSINGNIILKKLIVELILESVRLNSFADRPSRFNSVFLCEENMVGIWKSKLQAQPSVKVIKFETVSRQAINQKKATLDAFWVDNINVYDITQASEYAKKYWSGVMSEAGFIEVLYYGTLICKRE